MRVCGDVAGEGMWISVRRQAMVKFRLLEETNGGRFEEIEAEQETGRVAGRQFASKSANLIT